MVVFPSRLRRSLSPFAWLIGIAACVALAVLYVFTRTEVHTFDALSYTWALEAKPFGLLFHPHHLLYGPTGWLAYQVALVFGYVGRADTPVQIANAVAGALGVFFLWRFGTRWSGRSLTSLSVAILVGLCYAYWVYAAEVEVYTMATAFLTLSLWVLAILEERSEPGWAMALGLAHAGAMLFHQSNALFGLALVAFLLAKPVLRRPAIILVYAAAALLPLVLAYGAVAISSGFRSWEPFYRWFTDYAQSGQWGGYLSLVHWPALRSGLRITISPDGRLAAAVYGLILLGMAGGIWRAWRSTRRRPWVIMAGVWVLSYLLFFWWWEPWNIEFWIAVLPLAGLWILSPWPLPEEQAEAKKAAPRSLARLARPIYALIPAVLSVALFRAHFQPIRQAGDATEDYYRQVTDALVEVIEPDELVVTRGNVLDLYIPFYGRHPHVLSMRQLEQQAGGDRAQILGQLIGQLDWAVATGRPFLFDQFVLDEPREAIRNPFGLLPEEVRAIKERFPLEPLGFRGEQPLFYGTPRYANIGRTEWNFSESLQGWSASGIDNPRFEQEGWCFTGGTDPQLKGPLINIDAGRWNSLKLDVTIDADQAYAQLFWRSPDGEYSLDQSAEVQLRHGRWEYEVVMETMPGWGGTLASFRLDPIPGEDALSGGMACVHGISLTSADASSTVIRLD